MNTCFKANLRKKQSGESFLPLPHNPHPCFFFLTLLYTLWNAQNTLTILALEDSSEAARKNDTKSMRPSHSSEQSWEHFTVSCTVFHILSLSVRIVSSRDFPKWRARSQATSHLKTDHVLAPRLRAVSYFSLQSYCKRNPRRLSFSSGPNPLL